MHLDGPGVKEVARSLGVDFAPATIGFKYKAGGSRPVTRGIVVCKENVDAVVAAQGEWELKRRLVAVSLMM